MNPLLGLLASGLSQTPLGGLLGMGAPQPAPAPMGAPAPAPAPDGALGADFIVQGLLSRGLPLPVAQGIAGNLAVESGFDPGINEIAPTVPGSRGGFGLAQWTGPRRRALEAFAAERGLPVNDPNLQLDFLMSEINGSEAGNMRDTLAATTPEEAAAQFMSDFLRPGIPHEDRRLAATREIAGGGPPSLAFADPGAGSMSNASTSSTGSTPPMGLLTMPPEPERRPSIWDRAEGVPGLGLLADPDRRHRLAIALAGMSLRPNQGLIETLKGDLADSRDQEKQQRLAAWLGSQDNPTAQNLGAMIAAGLDGSAASSLLGAMQPPEPGPSYMTGAQLAEFYGVQAQDPNALFVNNGNGWQPVQGTGAPQAQTPTDDMREWEAAKAQGYQGTLQDWIMDSRRAGATTVTVGGEGQNIGTVPQGFAVVPDPSNPSGFRMERIPGGPEDTSAQTAATQGAQATSGDVVLSAAERARDAHRAGFGGLIGAGASYLPGTADAEVYRQVEVLKSNASIEALNAMRQQSPTGGALGNVTEGERATLAAKGGALDPKSPNFERDLADYTHTLLRVIHGPEAGDRIFAEQYGDGAPTGEAGGASGSGNLSDDDLLRMYGGQ